MRQGIYEPRKMKETINLSRQENQFEAEFNSSQNNSDDKGAQKAFEQVRKPFVEPIVSIPSDVLEATAFFQGSAALDTSTV